MTTPFSISGSFNFPEAPGLPQDAIPIGLTGQFTQRAEFIYTLSGSGTKVVDLGTIVSPGVKALLIQNDLITSGPSIGVKLNGSSVPVEVSSGGFVLLGSPTPSSGVTSVSIDFTGTCTVRIWALA